MSHSTPAKSRKPSKLLFSFRISATCARSRASSRPPAWIELRLWSAMPRYCKPELLRRRRHFLERIAAVARAGVAMKSAAQIFRLEQARQAPFRGRFDFAAIFAQLRRHEIEPERAIEFRFVADLRDFAAALFAFFVRRFFRRREPIFVQRPAALQRAVAQDDVVFLAAGEIAERKRIFGAAHDAQIGLDAGTQPHARFRRAARDDALDQRMLHEKICDRRRLFRRDDEIEIAHDLLPAPITSRDADVERVVGCCLRSSCKLLRLAPRLRLAKSCRHVSPGPRSSWPVFPGSFCRSPVTPRRGRFGAGLREIGDRVHLPASRGAP